MRKPGILRRQIPSVMATGILLVGLLFGCIGCNSTADSGSESSDCPESAELLDLIERFFTFYGMAEEPQVLVNEIPDNLPIDIPIPEKAEVIGSMAMNMTSGPQSIQIILDVPGEPEEVLEFYRDHLDADWEEQSHSREEGFVASGMGEIADFRSMSGNGGAFQVIAFSKENVTDVRLILTNGALEEGLRDEISTPQPMDSTPEESQAVLPSMEAPEDAIQWGSRHGGSNGSSSWGGSSGGISPVDRLTESRYSEANLETSMSLEQLQSYYTELLKQSDWTLDTSGVNYQVAWSTWSFNDYLGNQWDGFLLIRAMDQEDSKQLYLRADLVQFAEGVSEVPRPYGSWATAEPQKIPMTTPTSRPPECKASQDNSEFTVIVSGPSGLEFDGFATHEVDCLEGSQTQATNIQGIIGDEGAPLEFVASGIHISCAIENKTLDKQMTVVLFNEGVEVDRAHTTEEYPYDVCVNYYPPDWNDEIDEDDASATRVVVPGTNVENHPPDE